MFVPVLAVVLRVVQAWTLVLLTFGTPRRPGPVDLGRYNSEGLSHFCRSFLMVRIIRR